MKIIVEKNGEIKSVSPVGLKKFATILDVPQRIIIKSGPGQEVRVQVVSLQDKEKAKTIFLHGATIRVGISSGRIIDAVSGTTQEIITAINSDEWKKDINSSMHNNTRGIINADASTGLITKVLK